MDCSRASPQCSPALKPLLASCTALTTGALVQTLHARTHARAAWPNFNHITFFGGNFSVQSPRNNSNDWHHCVFRKVGMSLCFNSCVDTFALYHSQNSTSWKTLNNATEIPLCSRSESVSGDLPKVGVSTARDAANKTDLTRTARLSQERSRKVNNSQIKPKPRCFSPVI